MSLQHRGPLASSLKSVLRASQMPLCFIVEAQCYAFEVRLSFAAGLHVRCIAERRQCSSTRWGLRNFSCQMQCLPAVYIFHKFYVKLVSDGLNKIFLNFRSLGKRLLEFLFHPPDGNPPNIPVHKNGFAQ